MIALVLLGLLAFTSAAPHYHHHHRHGPSPFAYHDDDLLHQRFLQDDIFDTRGFWDELRKELLSLDTVIDDFVKHFPSKVSSEAIDGDVYKITIPLSGFEEKDIVVKAKKGLAMIQAVSNFNGMQRSYVDMRTLPDCVSENGKWSYENEVLKIEFPLSEKPVAPSTEAGTQAPDHSREEMETQTDDANIDVDVGSQRGDVDKETELLTNEVPTGHVEATTYAVDLKDDVEFVPVNWQAK